MAFPTGSENQQEDTIYEKVGSHQILRGKKLLSGLCTSQCQELSGIHVLFPGSIVVTWHNE